MPLHDWTDDRGWDSVHQLWINSLLFWLQDRLPAGYRAYLGSVPGLAIAAEPGRPDLGVRAWQPPGQKTQEPPSSALVDEPQPDFQAVALLNPEPPSAVHVFHQGRLVAAIELVSPRNKDRPSSRDFYRNRYLGYVWSGVNLLLADVHRRPSGYSVRRGDGGGVAVPVPGRAAASCRELERRWADPGRWAVPRRLVSVAGRRRTIAVFAPGSRHR